MIMSETEYNKWLEMVFSPKDPTQLPLLPFSELGVLTDGLSAPTPTPPPSYFDSIRASERSCTCPTPTLMRGGCKCGGV